MKYQPFPSLNTIVVLLAILSTPPAFGQDTEAEVPDQPVSAEADATAPKADETAPDESITAETTSVPSAPDADVATPPSETSAPAARSTKAPGIVNQAIGVLLDAVQQDDIEVFRTVANDQLTQTMSPPMLRNLHLKLAEFMKKGYDLHYFGQLDIRTEKISVHLFRMTFKENPELNDLLVEVSVKDGLISGFFILGDTGNAAKANPEPAQ